MLEVEVHPDQAMDENQERRGPEGGGNRRLASEFTLVEQGQNFTTSTGTLDREELSDLSDISTEIVATRRSPTGNTMMAGVTDKQATSLSLSERVKNTFGNIFHLPWERVKAMKENPRKNKRTMRSKSASIVPLRRIKHTPTEGLPPWTSLE